MGDNFYVIKRDGAREIFDLNKIAERVQKFVNFPYPLSDVDINNLTHNAISGLSYEIHTSQIDTYIANIASSLGIQNRNYLVLASRIVIDDHHKMTLDSFSKKIELLFNYKDKNGRPCPLIS